MKQLKNYNRIIIFVFLFSIFYFLFSTVDAGVVEDLKKNIGEKENKIRELEIEAENYKKNIKTTKVKQITLKTQIKEIEEDIGELNFNINITQTKIDKQELEIEQLNLEIENLAQSIKKWRKNLEDLLRTLEREDQKDIISIILINKNLSKIFNQLEYLESLQEEASKKLDGIKKAKISSEAKKNLEEIKKFELEGLKNNLTAQKKITDLQKKHKNDLLKQTKNQESRFQKLLTETQKKRQEIQKELSDLEEKLRFTIDPNTIPSPRSGLLEWPTEGILSQKYGPTSETGFINHAYKFHNGIDIAASIGVPIKATKDGLVKAIGDNGIYSYGKWIAIDHENGLITLSAHLSLINVQNGQKVRVDDIIGYMGSTGFSTGPHLHFTVYAANTFILREKWYGLTPIGGSVDPLKYL